MFVNNLNMTSVRFCVLCISLFAVCCGHGTFKRFIPNGHRVPDPCGAGTTAVWQWVGHVTLDPWPQQNAQQLNAFGQHFKYIKNLPLGIEKIWPLLCPVDSDGDGLTNGAELGDINCNWRYGDPIPDIPPLSHPGIPENKDGTLAVTTRSQFCRPA